jgi:hypothetical protein
VRIIVEWLLLLLLVDTVKNGFLVLLAYLLGLANKLVLPIIDGAYLILDFGDEVCSNMLKL